MAGYVAVRCSRARSWLCVQWSPEQRSLEICSPMAAPVAWWRCKASNNLVWAALSFQGTQYRRAPAMAFVWPSMGVCMLMPPQDVSPLRTCPTPSGVQLS